MGTLALYELSETYRRALEAFTDPDVDLPAEAVADTLEGLEGALQDKAVNVAKFMRNLEAFAEAVKAAEENMARRRKAIENRARWIKDYLKTNMEACGIQKIESPWFVLAIQKNPAAVEILNEAAVPDEFNEAVITVKLDKAGIKQAIEAGREVPGAALSRGTRLVVR
ncbi:siphovirus Gp157 family protein [Methylolobus aquaticus]